MEAGGSGMLKKQKSQLGMPSGVRTVDRQVWVEAA